MSGAVRAPGSGWYVLAGTVALCGFLTAGGLVAVSSPRSATKPDLSAASPTASVISEADLPDRSATAPA